MVIISESCDLFMTSFSALFPLELWHTMALKVPSHCSEIRRTRDIKVIIPNVAVCIYVFIILKNRVFFLNKPLVGFEPVTPVFAGYGVYAQ